MVFITAKVIKLYNFNLRNKRSWILLQVEREFQTVYHIMSYNLCVLATCSKLFEATPKRVKIKKLMTLP